MATIANIWRTLVGNPLETARLGHERLTKIKGLAVFSSDALSSVAYASEEIVLVLVAAGAAGLAYTVPIAIAIVTVLAIVITSYYQTIHAYPSGGGAYIVAHDNLGTAPGLIAAAALLIDYVLTVSVSISSGVAALTSAVPTLFPYRVELAIGFVAVIMIGNLRGVRESGTIFAFPTYFFIATFLALVFVGLARTIGSGAPPAHAVETVRATAPVTLFLLLRAFSQGSAAMTGVEAISNGIPAFYPPESRNASRTLIAMGALLATMFLGLSYMAYARGILPKETETIASQVTRAVFGTSVMYYAVQAGTMLILVLAANTSFADFPRLASILGRDRYLPRQFANLGDRLTFSNGILVLGILASLLVVAFQADTHALIPLYTVGVFLSFTLSQSGMVVHWLRQRWGRWRLKILINGVGATATGVALAIAILTKFVHGAWIVVGLIPALVVLMRSISTHYREVAAQLSLEGAAMPRPFTSHTVVIPVNTVHRGILEAVRYAQSISKDVVGLYVETEPARTAEMIQKWEQWAPEVPLVILPSPYRSLITPLLSYLDLLQERGGPQMALTVVLPEFVPVKWWHHLLHNQNALILKFSLLFRRRKLRRYKVVADVPYYLRR